MIDLRKSSPILTAPAYLDGRQQESTIDTGAGRALVNVNIVRSWRKPEQAFRVIAADGEQLAMKGVKTIEFEMFEENFNFEFLVIEGLD